MIQRSRYWLSMGQLILSFLIFASAGAQPIQVTGFAGTTSNYVTEFYGNYFTVQRNDGYAIVDLSGKTLLSGIKAPVIGFINKFSVYKGVFFETNGGDIVLKNVAGQTLGTGKYLSITPFVTGNTVVRVHGAPGTWVMAYVDTAGRELARFDIKRYLSITDQLNKIGSIGIGTMEDLLPFSEGLTPIRSVVSKKVGFINPSLQLVIPVSFKEASPFSEGLAEVENADGNWGFIDKTGRLVISYDYSIRPSRFMSGLAKVTNKEGKIGFINKENKVVIAPHFVYATNFYKGYALAKEGYVTAINLIDTTGAVVATFSKDLVYIDDSKPSAGIGYGDQSEYPFYVSETLRQLVDEGEAIFMKAFKYGVVDRKGNLVLDFKYSYLSGLRGGKMFADGSAGAKSQMGILDDKGNWVVVIAGGGF